MIKSHVANPKLWEEVLEVGASYVAKWMTIGMSSDAMQIIRRDGNDRNRRAHDSRRLTGVIGSKIDRSYRLQRRGQAWAGIVGVSAGDCR